MNKIKQLIPVSQLRSGDTVEINGQLKTVSSKYIKYCSFMGTTFEGQSFPNGIVLIKFKVPVKNGYRIQG